MPSAVTPTTSRPARRASVAGRGTLSGPQAGSVVARVRATGTHEGEFMGMPATGRSADVQLIDIIRFGDDGLAHEHWGVFDELAMMQQLGAIPETPPAWTRRRR